MSILVPDKTTEFTAFITNLPPDLEAVHHAQVYPLSSPTKSATSGVAQSQTSRQTYTSTKQAKSSHSNTEGVKL